MTTLDFSSSEAALRIRRVQLLCKQNDLDGVLLVPGVDGRFSVCNQAMGYLFEGHSNRDTVDVAKLDDQLDEAVALITPTAVCMYAPTPELRDRLQQLLVPYVTDLRILSPTPSEAADADQLEETKLAAFVHLVRGCRRLGIPCRLAGTSTGTSTTPQHQQQQQQTATPTSATSNGGPPPPSASRPAGGPPSFPLLRPQQLGAGALMELERWPLLQAYGLEGVGRSGFFTMNVEVYDVQAALHQQLYGSLDSRSLAALLGEGVPSLRQHWDEMMQVLGGKPPGQRGGLTERQMGEPLAGYFAYGLLRPAPGVEQAVTQPPRVVFGPRTSDDSAASEAVPLAAPLNHPPGGPAGQPGAGELPALHLVAEAADPRSGLRVARTYFLSRGVVERDVFADPDEEADEGYCFTTATADWGPRGEDAVLLMRTYSALVEAGRAAMKHFAEVPGATALSAKAEAQEVLARRAEQQLEVAGGPGAAGGQALAARLRFALWQVDHCNHVTTPAARGSRQLKVLRLSLPDITSRSTGRVLGGLVYGDTFLDLPPLSGDLPPPAEGPGLAPGGGGSGGSLLVLTACVPALVAVPAGGCEEALAARALRSLGRVVDGGAGSQSTRAANLASQRDQERRAAGAAAESQALAARLRALRAGAAPVGGGTSEGEEEDDNPEEGGEAASPGGNTASPAPAATAAAPRVPPGEALGRLLTLGGGDEAVLLTGAPSCPSLSGSLHCFTCGLVFVEGASRAVWALDLRRPGALQAVTMQHVGPLGEAVVFRGTSPACGLAPATHLTANTHLALPLAAMTPAARRFLIQTVLPAWQQTCREAALAAGEEAHHHHHHSAPGGAGTGAGAGAAATPTRYLKDMAASNPFPPALYQEHAHAVQTSAAGGASKVWSGAVADGEEVAELLARLDRAEVRGPLSGLDPQVEALLLQGQPPGPYGAVAGPQHAATGRRTGAPAGGAVTLVVGLPGGEGPAVAGAVAAMLASAGGEGTEQVAPLVALLPAAPGPLTQADFAAALEAAASSAVVTSANGGDATGSVVRHLVLATSSYTGLYEQLCMLAGAAVGGAAGRWWLASVVVACSADVAWEEPTRGTLAVGQLAQLAPGCVDCIVLGGGEAAKVTRLSQLVAARLPGVPQVRSGRTQLLRARGELLPAPGERLGRLAGREAAAARCWGPLLLQGAPPEQRGAGGGGGGVLGPLQACRVVFEGALDVGKLREALAELGAPQDPAAVPPLPLADTSSDGPTGRSPGGPGPGGLVAVHGCVRLAPATRPSELLASRQTGLRIREWPLAGMAVVAGVPRLPPDEKLLGGELLFVGSGAALQEPALRALLARCGTGSGGAVSSSAAAAAAAAGGAAPGSKVDPAPPPSSSSQLTLTPSQRAAVRSAHLFDPLPEGYCFNGTQYFDAFGDASLEHPHMDRFIAQWLAEQREQAAAAAGSRAAEGPSVLRVMGPVTL